MVKDLKFCSAFFLLQRINNFLVFTFFYNLGRQNAAAKKNKLSFELLLGSLAASAFEGNISCVMWADAPEGLTGSSEYVLGSLGFQEKLS